MPTRCKKCGREIYRTSEKALDGEYAIVWTDGVSWICVEDGDEHAPEEPEEPKP